MEASYNNTQGFVATADLPIDPALKYGDETSQTLARLAAFTITTAVTKRCISNPNPSRVTAVNNRPYSKERNKNLLDGYHDYIVSCSTLRSSK